MRWSSRTIGKVLSDYTPLFFLRAIYPFRRYILPTSVYGNFYTQISMPRLLYLNFYTKTFIYKSVRYRNFYKVVYSVLIKYLAARLYFSILRLIKLLSRFISLLIKLSYYITKNLLTFSILR